MALGVRASCILGEIHVENRLCRIRSHIAHAGGNVLCCGDRLALGAKGSDRLYCNRIGGLRCKILYQYRPVVLLVRRNLIVVVPELTGFRLARGLIRQGNLIGVDHVVVLAGSRSCCREGHLDRGVGQIRGGDRCALCEGRRRALTLAAIGCVRIEIRDQLWSVDDPGLLIIHVFTGRKIHASNGNNVLVRNINGQRLRGNLSIHRIGRSSTGIRVDFARFIFEVRANSTVLNSCKPSGLVNRAVVLHGGM